MRRLVGTRRRRVAAAVSAVVLAGGVIAAAIAGSGGAASARSDGFSPTMHFKDVVAHVQHSFGDGRIVSASVAGSLLSVRLDLTRRSSQAAQIKGVFEAQVLGHAVVDWMRFHGRKPITTVTYRDTAGKTVLGYGDLTLEPDPNASPLRAGACSSVAKGAAKSTLQVASAQTLPYVHGTCVFELRTSQPKAGSEAAMGALEKIISRIGPPNLRPWYFELVDAHGVPLSAASWLDDAGGTTWAKPGSAYALPHN